MCSTFRNNQPNWLCDMYEHQDIGFIQTNQIPRSVTELQVELFTGPSVSCIIYWLFLPTSDSYNEPIHICTCKIECVFHTKFIVSAKRKEKATWENQSLREFVRPWHFGWQSIESIEELMISRGSTRQHHSDLDGNNWVFTRGLGNIEAQHHPLVRFDQQLTCAHNLRDMPTQPFLF